MNAQCSQGPMPSLLGDSCRVHAAPERLVVVSVMEEIAPHLGGINGPLLVVRASMAFLRAVGGSQGRGPLMSWIPIALAPDLKSFQ